MCITHAHECTPFAGLPPPTRFEVAHKVPLPTGREKGRVQGEEGEGGGGESWWRRRSTQWGRDRGQGKG